MRFDLFLASRYLRHRQGARRFSGLTAVIGVSLGVLLMLVVLAVLNGLAGDLKTRILSTESHIQITPRDGSVFSRDAELDSILAQLPHVRSFGIFAQGEVLLLNKGQTSGALLYGVDIDTPGRIDELRRMTKFGDLRISRSTGLIVGSLLARRLVAAPGDTLLLATPAELMPRPGSRPPRLNPIPVSAIFESGLPDYDAVLAFLPIQMAADVLRGHGISGVEIWLDAPDEAPRVARRIRTSLPPRLKLDVRHWGELNRNLFDALRLEKAAMFLVLALVIIIAALNITGGILRNVMQRRGEIAMVMTMGCRRRTVLSVFLMEGILTGAVGAAAGGGMGYLTIRLIVASGILVIPGDLMPFPSLPLAMRLFDFVLVSVAAILITTISAAYPAYRASRMDPVAVFRDL